MDVAITVRAPLLLPVLLLQLLWCAPCPEFNLHDGAGNKCIPAIWIPDWHTESDFFFRV